MFKICVSVSDDAVYIAVAIDKIHFHKIGLWHIKSVISLVRSLSLPNLGPFFNAIRILVRVTRVRIAAIITISEIYNVQYNSPSCTLKPESSPNEPVLPDEQSQAAHCLLGLLLQQQSIGNAFCFLDLGGIG